jgi:hypothetical protein
MEIKILVPMHIASSSEESVWMAFDEIYYVTKQRYKVWISLGCRRYFGDIFK